MLLFAFKGSGEMATPRFYTLKQSDLEFGDYHDILAHGMATRTSDDDALILERTGPYVPPWSMPSWDYVVVTAEFLQKVRDSRLTGYDVIPVIKKKVTNIDWRNWEPYGPKEFKYPAGNEPENYIERRKHSLETAEAIGELWHLRFKPGISRSTDEGVHHFRLSGNTWNGADFFTEGGRTTTPYVSERGRDWLLANVSEWVSFSDLPVIWNTETSNS